MMLLTVHLESENLAKWPRGYKRETMNRQRDGGGPP